MNERHFKKPVKQITMKYATSFWGHCSRNGHIVISARLMFAPQRVIDYVFIHELAHLVHMDHSPRFWKVVEQVMPDYRNKAGKAFKGLPPEILFVTDFRGLAYLIIRFLLQALFSIRMS